MSRDDKSHLSALKSYPSLQDYLIDLGLSKRKIKQALDKKRLQKSVEAKSSLTLPISLRNTSHINPCYTGKEIKVIFEDEIFIVFDKPASTHCHPLDYEDQNNVLSFARDKSYFELLKVAPHTPERGLIHRLDKSTSGVLIGVKKQAAYDHIRENFESVVFVKEYRALDRGECPLEGPR